MCEYHEQLQQAQYELGQMWTKGVWDYGRLKQLLDTNQALQHEGHG